MFDRITRNTTREDHAEWGDKIPYIKFPDTFKVKVLPAFGGAVARFRVSDLEEKASVSVYLDCYDALGCYREPYWEVYPIDEDTFRCDMADTDSLIKEISRSLEQQLK